MLGRVQIFGRAAFLVLSAVLLSAVLQLLPPPPGGIVLGDTGLDTLLPWLVASLECILFTRDNGFTCIFK